MAPAAAAKHGRHTLLRDANKLQTGFHPIAEADRLLFARRVDIWRVRNYHAAADCAAVRIGLNGFKLTESHAVDFGGGGVLGPMTTFIMQ